MILNSKTELNQLTAISPIDGRYFPQVQVLSDYFSEYAYLRTGLGIELKYIIFLSELKIFRTLTNKEKKFIDNIYSSFTTKKAYELKEKGTPDGLRIHDLKSIEYYIKSIFLQTSLSDVVQWIHFGLTSNDIVDNAYRTLVQQALKDVLIPKVENLLSMVNKIAKRFLKLPMLGRTHGQAAVPTTFGKEIAVFSARIKKELINLKKTKLYGKFGGAVGNWNSLNFTFPEQNWPALATRFLKKIGLERSGITTQIAPTEDLINIFQNIFRINSILLDFNQDIWRYISDAWVVQKGKSGIVGSSTMPQKVNPLEFENSEGNLVMANGLFETFSRKLPISRLQRDLSDSTVLRNVGVAFAHTLVAFASCKRGLTIIEPNKNKMLNDLNDDWSILSEALQTVMRKQGKADAYEKVAIEVRGKKIKQSKWKKMINTLDLPEKVKIKLVDLAPKDYIGIIQTKW